MNTQTNIASEIETLRVRLWKFKKAIQSILTE